MMRNANVLLLAGDWAVLGLICIPVYINYNTC